MDAVEIALLVEDVDNAAPRANHRIGSGRVLQRISHKYLRADLLIFLPIERPINDVSLQIGTTGGLPSQIDMPFVSYGS